MYQVAKLDAMYTAAAAATALSSEDKNVGSVCTDQQLSLQSCIATYFSKNQDDLINQSVPSIVESTRLKPISDWWFQYWASLSTLLSVSCPCISHGFFSWNVAFSEIFHFTDRTVVIAALSWRQTSRYAYCHPVVKLWYQETKLHSNSVLIETKLALFEVNVCVSITVLDRLWNIHSDLNRTRLTELFLIYWCMALKLVYSPPVQVFLKTHENKNFNGRAVARIFHGLWSPAYPYAAWCKNHFW